ncbi:MAG: alpha-ketoglutarate-dependent dioxygenase AlkB [Pseudomonadota bacterium]
MNIPLTDKKFLTQLKLISAEQQSNAPMKPKINFIENWLTLTEQTELWKILNNKVSWEQPKIQIAGKRLLIPRKQAWYGDENAHYKYSSIHCVPTPWTAELFRLKQRLENTINFSFNSVLLNLYSNGQESMGWHSDDETELGAEPWIASISLGATRRFRFRLKKNHRIVHAIDLTGRSLLIMHPSVQYDWQHALPKTKRVVEPRINLTFRYVY